MIDNLGTISDAEFVRCRVGGTTARQHRRRKIPVSNIEDSEEITTVPTTSPGNDEETTNNSNLGDEATPPGSDSPTVPEWFRIASELSFAFSNRWVRLSVFCRVEGCGFCFLPAGLL